MSDRMTLFELKEKAKWSSDPEEKKAAIKELSTYGENAISQLQEIMSITAYEDIRNACAEAIKSVHARSKVEINETSSTTTDRSMRNAAADDVVMTKDQKKKISKRKAKAREKP